LLGVLYTTTPNLVSLKSSALFVTFVKKCYNNLKMDDSQDKIAKKFNPLPPPPTQEQKKVFLNADI